jgi:hypothetical protein
MNYRPRSKRLPDTVRAQALAAARSARDVARANGADASEVRRAYHSAYNTVRAGYLYTYNADFRASNLAAQRKYRGRGRTMVKPVEQQQQPVTLWARLMRWIVTP